MIAATFLLGCSETDGFGPPDGAPNIDLRVQQAVDPTSVSPGGTVTFTVTVRNLGPIAATGVIAGDTLPTGLSYSAHTVSAGNYTPTSGLWTIGDLAVNQDATLTLTSTVNAGTGGSTLTNRAGVISTTMNDTVPANNVAEASVTVNPAPGLILHSTFSTALGSSDLALSDGGLWDRLFCTPAQRAAVMRVVEGGPVGWTRTPNVMRMTQRGPSFCGNIELQVDSPVPQSTTHWGRFYFRDDETQSGHGHPVAYLNLQQDGHSFQIIPWVRSGGASGTIIGMQWMGNSYPLNRFHAGVQGVGNFRFPHDTWFRYEWMIEYVTPTTARFYPRVYNMNGDLLFDANTFFQQDPQIEGFVSLQSRYDAGFTLTITSPSLARQFGFGNEGPGGSVDSGEHWYFADVALSLNGWIGQ